MLDSSNGTSTNIKAMCDDHSSFPTEVMDCVTSSCNVQQLRGSSSVLCYDLANTAQL